ncbi:hypothetical protein BRC84_03240 [Halobacteriales archaeon QS_1_68_44]|nr:MAG: hypothetical protein BRC84_03240 [Halobacteriales archaeon QS_1_68_44]
MPTSRPPATAMSATTPSACWVPAVKKRAVPLEAPVPELPVGPLGHADRQGVGAVRAGHLGDGEDDGLGRGGRLRAGRRPVVRRAAGRFEVGREHRRLGAGREHEQRRAHEEGDGDGDDGHRQSVLAGPAEQERAAIAHRNHSEAGAIAATR